MALAARDTLMCYFVAKSESLAEEERCSWHLWATSMAVFSLDTSVVCVGSQVNDGKSEVIFHDNVREVHG